MEMIQLTTNQKTNKISRGRKKPGGIYGANVTSVLTYFVPNNIISNKVLYVRTKVINIRRKKLYVVGGNTNNNSPKAEPFVSASDGEVRIVRPVGGRLADEACAYTYII